MGLSHSQVKQQNYQLLAFSDNLVRSRLGLFPITLTSPSVVWCNKALLSKKKKKKKKIIVVVVSKKKKKKKKKKNFFPFFLNDFLSHDVFMFVGTCIFFFFLLTVCGQ